MASSSKTLSSAALFLCLNLIFSMFSSATATTCPIDTLKLNVCAAVLGGSVNASVSSSPCCTLVNNLVDLDAAVCLCTALKAGILGVIVDVSLSLKKILLNDCGKTWPSGFTC